MTPFIDMLNGKCTSRQSEAGLDGTVGGVLAAWLNAHYYVYWYVQLYSLSLVSMHQFKTHCGDMPRILVVRQYCSQTFHAQERCTSSKITSVSLLLINGSWQLLWGSLPPPSGLAEVKVFTTMSEKWLMEWHSPILPHIPARIRQNLIYSESGLLHSLLNVRWVNVGRDVGV